MQETGSIIICGHDAECLALAKKCSAAGIHPTLLLTRPSLQNPLRDPEDVYITRDAFSCVADFVTDRSGDDADTIVSRLNQLAEINHGDVVFAISATPEQLDGLARRIMHPSRVVGLLWPDHPETQVHIFPSSHTSESTIAVTTSLVASLGLLYVVR